MILAKVTGPLFSQKASGKYGDHLIFFGMNDNQFVKMYGKPEQVNSMAQLECQNIFSKGGQLYQKLSDYDRKAWKLLARDEKHNAYNHFTGLAYRSIKETGKFTFIYDFSIDEIYADNATINFYSSDDCTLILYLKE
ncbi:MAG: hypothetical protein ABR596_06520, partial [Halarsenatibacteraceae bacterium]